MCRVQYAFIPNSSPPKLRVHLVAELFEAAIQRLRWADVQDDTELQSELSDYRKFYNEQRPHIALAGGRCIANSG